jgi:ABC-type branched-subunit amino acid transport system substrate-binding protein
MTSPATVARIAIVVIVMAACGSQGSPATTGATGTGTDQTGTSATTTTTAIDVSKLDAAEVARKPGVTDDRVKVGVTYIDEPAMYQMNVLIRRGEYKHSYEVLIDQINRHGGINGRRIDLVFKSIDLRGTEPGDQVCDELADQERVFVVVGFFLNDAVLCPVERHDLAVIGGTQSPERLARAKAPWFTTDPSTDYPKRIVKVFADKGVLTGKIAVFAGAGDESLLHEVHSELHDLGVQPVGSGVFTTDPNDGDHVGEIRTIARGFQSKGADSVLLVGARSSPWFSAMEGETYRPRLLVTDRPGVTDFTTDAATTDTSLLEGSVIGGTYGPDTRSYDEPRMQQCVHTLQQAGINVPRPIPTRKTLMRYLGPFDACTHVALLEALLQGAGRELDYATLRYAGDHLGDLSIPGDPSPRTYGPPPATDGSPEVNLLTWNAARATFVPTG